MSCQVPGVSPEFQKAFCGLFTSFFRVAANPPEDDALMQRARLFIWQLDRAYAEATGGESAYTLLAELDQLLLPADQVRNALVAWVNVVESLVQEAERQYGSQGRGSYKAEQVKAVLIHLFLDDPAWKIPNVPDFLLPVGVELIASWSIDAIVVLLNHNDAWVPAPTKGDGAPAASLPARIIMAVAKWLQEDPFLRSIGAVFARWGRKMVLAAHPLNSAAQEALAELQRPGMPTIQTVADRTAQIGVWVAQHRKQVVAFIELVTIAVREAEAFEAMSGPEKKEYARDLVIALLEDSGFIRENTPFSNFITEWLIDWGIDAVVMLFNKRQVFQHQQPLTSRPYHTVSS